MYQIKHYSNNLLYISLKVLAQKVRQEKGKVAVSIEECIVASKESAAYNRQKWQLERYENIFAKYYSAIIKQGLFRNKIIFISDPFLYATKILTIIFGGAMVVEGSISPGVFVAIFALVESFVTELGQLFEQALVGKKLEAAVSHIQDVMNLNESEFGDVEFKDDVMSIKFEEVTFSYETESDIILNNISLDLEVGKKIAFVGESGSGKSTLAHLLVRSYLPSKGRVLVNDVNVQDYNQGYVDKVAIVFQQPHFIPMSIRENILFNTECSENQLIDICKKMCCHEFIEDFPEKYETIVGEKGANLSGGQKQRIALTRALVKNPDILILDEATSALDTQTEWVVQKNIDELRKGKTTIIIAHRISTIQNADVIYVMDKGKIVSSGAHEYLIENCKIYRRLNAI